MRYNTLHTAPLVIAGCPPAFLGKVLLLMCAAVLSFGCSRKTVYSISEGPLSEMEERKSRLDSVIGDIMEPFGLSGDEKVEDLTKILTRDGSVALRSDGSVVYTLVRRGQVIFTVKLSVGNLCCGEVNLTVLTCSDLWMDGKVKISPLMCGLGCLAGEGESFISGVSKFDSAMDVDVYTGDDKIAKLGLEPLHITGAGEDRWDVMLVLRFEDGTTYDITSLLLVSSMLDYFLSEEHIGQTIWSSENDTDEIS